MKRQPLAWGESMRQKDRPESASHKGSTKPGASRGGQSARGLALRVLADLRGGRLTARESIETLIARQPLGEQDLGLATELVMGVVRHRLTLARVLGELAAHGWKRVSERLQHILMIGAYQLIWLDGVPAFAAVNEAVEQAKVEGGAKAGRFVNAVLRQLLRDVEERRIPTAKADPIRAIPIDANVSCQFSRPVMPDPAATPDEYLADSTSHPLWLVSRWVHAFGRERAEQVCRADMQRAPVVLRPNRLRIDAAGLAERLRDEGYPADVTQDRDAVVTRRAAGLMGSAAFREGLFQPQDLTSIEAIRAGAKGLQAGQVVVDLCAGLGTKTTQMAELMRNQGVVIASDRDEVKLGPLQSNCERLGVTIVRSVPPTGLRDALTAPPDWIIIDAPCSNTGVLARRPEARYRLNQRAIDSLAAIQAELLEQAARLAGPKTELLYSTCSIDPEEDEAVSKEFARKHAGWVLADSRLTLPQPVSEGQDWHDGGYWARWERE